jgi:hypothetical protein
MDIRKKLWQVFKNGESIHLLNHFQGIPVTCSTGIYLLGEDILAVKVQPRYLALIKHERRTVLNLDSAGGMFKAVPIALEIKDNMVVLGQFAALIPSARQRVFEVCVAPKEEVPVMIYPTRELEFNGVLRSMRMGASGSPVLRVALDGSLSVLRHEPWQLELIVPGTGHVTREKGLVTHINHQNRAGKSRLVVQVDLDDGSNTALQGYLALRKVEIEADWADA